MALSDHKTNPVAQPPVRLICLLLALITLALYWPVRHFEFNNYDDAQYLTENPQVQNGLTVHAITWAFTTGYAANWHPLTWLSHLLDFQMFGFNAGGHHLTNLVFHIANTLLLFLLVYRWSGAVWRSAFVAALFAWHPLHVESVAWVAERKDVLSTFFWLLTMLAYGKYAAVSKNPLGPVTQFSEHAIRNSQFAIRYYLLTLVLFTLGLLSKPMVVSLPLILLLLDYSPLHRIEFPLSISNVRSLFIEKIPFFLLAAASCVITFLVQRNGQAVQSLETLPLGDRIANALLAYVHYLAKLFWPTNLAVLYPLPHNYPTLAVIGATILLLAISALAVCLAKTHPPLFVGWFWFLITLVPVIGIVQVGGQAFADRYTYIPSIGLFLIVAWEIPRLFNVFTNRQPSAALLTKSGQMVPPLNEPPTKHVAFDQERPDGSPSPGGEGRGEGGRPTVPRGTEAELSTNVNNQFNIPIAFLASIILIACLFATSRQLGYWQNSVTLFTRAIQVTTNNAIAECDLGLGLATQGRTNDAILHEQAALAINSNYPVAENNLGMLLGDEGRRDEAITHLLAAIKCDPQYDQAHCNLGSIYFRQGRLDDAIAEFRAALAINPQYDKAYANLGIALARQGHMDEAIDQYRRALAIAPNNAYAQNALGLALENKNQLTDAAAHYSAAVRAKPDFAEARENLGVILTLQGNFAQADDQLSQALKLQPASPSIHYNLGNALIRENKVRAAADQYSEAVRLQPDHLEAHFNLALVLAQLGQTAEAIPEFRAVLRLNPQTLPALEKLAWLLATDSDPQLRNGPEALRLATQAVQLAPADPIAWDAQAAAFAESGKFPEAVTAANKALNLANGHNPDFSKQIQGRLQLYQSGAPFHETARK